MNVTLLIFSLPIWIAQKIYISNDEELRWVHISVCVLCSYASYWPDLQGALLFQPNCHFCLPTLHKPPAGPKVCGLLRERALSFSSLQIFLWWLFAQHWQKAGTWHDWQGNYCNFPLLITVKIRQTLFPELTWRVSSVRPGQSLTALHKPGEGGEAWLQTRWGMIPWARLCVREGKHEGVSWWEGWGGRGKWEGLPASLWRFSEICTSHQGLWSGSPACRWVQGKARDWPRGQSTQG